jgi:hypothetical protein
MEFVRAVPAESPGDPSCRTGGTVSSDPRLVYQQGDHVCTLYSTAEEQLAVATEYIRGGLARGERCLYIVCEHDVGNFRNSLRAAGIEVEREEARGALVLLNKGQGHLAEGTFDPARMIERLDAAVKQALDDGFTGLCAGGDMSWVLDEAPGTEKVGEYEALLNRFYRDNRALGLCLYNRNKVPAAILDHGLATHSKIRVDGPILLNNPF